ncbi:hypothetical protein OESDEN_05118 [Oesophagostomum dentatum]|uniref:Integrase catalytic domain-containing protein n=1 Tax=Oesophagostomum dentatum TaxID=61180 RepID=A0A0B1TCC8_OESDE|nr:hypothetical protein OESDEN_05118 [Oesophagostomum dentatum]
MPTGAFLNCLKRFISRRGVPDLMRSDCGANFELGHKIIDILYESGETTETTKRALLHNLGTPPTHVSLQLAKLFSWNKTYSREAAGYMGKLFNS